MSGAPHLPGPTSLMWRRRRRRRRQSGPQGSNPSQSTLLVAVSTQTRAKRPSYRLVPAAPARLWALDSPPRAMQAPPLSIGALPDDLLVRIFAAVPFLER